MQILCEAAYIYYPQLCSPLLQRGTTGGIFLCIFLQKLYNLFNFCIRLG